MKQRKLPKGPQPKEDKGDGIPFGFLSLIVMLVITLITNYGLDF